MGSWNGLKTVAIIEEDALFPRQGPDAEQLDRSNRKARD
jgi:hypothetical protein